MTIAVFPLGGTIAMYERDGVVTRLTGADLTVAIPELADIGAGLDVRDVVAVPSADLTFAGMLEVIAAAERAVADGATGAVVIQGTDTLEETAVLATPLDAAHLGLPASPIDIDETRVGLYTISFDDDGALLAHVAEAYQGLVVAGFGVGRVPSWIAPVLGDLAEQMPVVLTSRTGG